MANKGHLKILKRGVDAWNRWRDKNPNIVPDLSGCDFGQSSLSFVNFDFADLSKARFRGADLAGSSFVQANLSQADLRGADLTTTFLHETNLEWADLEGVNLLRADLYLAYLSRTDLSNANIEGTNFNQAIVIEPDLGGTRLLDTVFYDVDLSTVKNLERCDHQGPSCVDHRTIAQSKNVPISFWRGCGLPDSLIDYMPSLTGDAIQFYSCFISHSTKDIEFAERFHADLQDNNVRCWFSPHDMPIGEKLWDSIDQEIRVRDKVLLILSEDALASDWVENEVTAALAEERRRKKTVLFPVTLDECIHETAEPWARLLRNDRLIGDFIGWKDHDAYKRTFKRVLRDLKKEG